MLKHPAETAAFEKFWLSHRPRVWRLVARLAANVDLADNLTQEVSLRAIQAFSTFRGGSAGSPASPSVLCETMTARRMMRLGLMMS